jgi:16S rRNA (cytosine1402-N4)-methyltransferase
MEGASEHIPVLCNRILQELHIQAGGRYIDATVGAGGHAAAILRASAPSGLLLGLDADPEAVTYARQALSSFGERVSVQQANFRNLKQAATSLGFEGVHGVLMDLGISSRQLADALRGFSFSHDGPLDMRLNPYQGISAAELVNGLPEAKLADVLWQYGEERFARRLARAIVTARPLTTTGQLADLVARTVGHREKIHPATRTFQALRIAVNDELVSLAAALPQAVDLLQPGGRVAVVAFHSLEDRIVKGFYRREALDCVCPPETPICVCQHRARLRVLTRKPIHADEREIAHNPRSRSARLRVAERL